MERVRFLDEPFLGQRTEAGNPAVALGEVRLGSRYAFGAPHCLDGCLLGVYPHFKGGIEAAFGLVAHVGDVRGPGPSMDTERAPAVFVSEPSDAEVGKASSRRPRG